VASARSNAYDAPVAVGKGGRDVRASVGKAHPVDQSAGPGPRPSATGAASYGACLDHSRARSAG